jgi:hypothetical protein
VPGGLLRFNSQQQSNSGSGVWDNPSGTEGTPLTAPVATFTYSNLQNGGSISGYSATINWGDGNTSSGTLSLDANRNLLVSGAHVFVEEGTYSGSVTVTGPSSSQVTVQGSFTIADASLASTGQTVSAVAGGTFSGQVALLTDGNPDGSASDFSASINWGNGQATSGTIGSANGQYTVSGSTTYTTPGLDRITVTITDKGGQSTVVQSAANVSAASLSAGALNLTATEGIPFSGVVGSFTDANSSDTINDYTATIDWGNGRVTAGTPTANPQGGYSVTASNTYMEPGTYNYQLRILNRLGGRTTTNGRVTVTDAALQTHSVAIYAIEGEPFYGVVATFTDADPAGRLTDYTATISWGDGQTSAGTVQPSARGGFNVMGSHTYQEEGTYPVTVQIHDRDGSTGNTATAAIVSDAPLTADANLPSSAFQLSTTTGVPYNGEVARFTDADPSGVLSDYSAIINWGDGTSSPGTVSNFPLTALHPIFLVSGSHTYSTVGNYSITTSIADVGGSIATSRRAMVVSPPPLSISPGSPQFTEGVAFSGDMATFTDADPNGASGNYVATINWGDGTTSAGQIRSLSGGGFAVSGSHTFAEEGREKIQVLVQDSDGASATTKIHATVLDGTLASQGIAIQAIQGVSFSGAVAKIEDANTSALATDFQTTIAWGDGQTSVGQVVATGAGNFQVNGTHVYNLVGDYTIAMNVSDAGGSTTAIAANANVIVAPVVVTGVPISATAGVVFSGTVATFYGSPNDTSPSDFQATIKWGDGGTSSGVIATNPSSGDPFIVTGSHTYANAGYYAATVIVTSIEGGTGQAGTIASVSGGSSAANLSEQEGKWFSGIMATLGAPASGDSLTTLSASIAWGDGTTSVGTVATHSGGGFDIYGANGYVEEGYYSICVTLSDTQGNSLLAYGAATVADAPLAVSAQAISSVAYTPFSGEIATFRDSDTNGTLSDYSATINWGDGTTTAGVIATGSAGLDQVSGSHTYLHEGAYTTSITVVDQGGATTTSQSTASIADVPLSGSGRTLNAYTSLPFYGVVATFIDGDPNGVPADFSASIDWGNGTTSSGTIQVNPSGGFAVYGAQTFVHGGSFPVNVQIQDVGGANIAVSSTISVATQPLSVTAHSLTSNDTSFAGPMATINASSENARPTSRPRSTGETVLQRRARSFQTVPRMVAFRSRLPMHTRPSARTPCAFESQVRAARGRRQPRRRGLAFPTEPVLQVRREPAGRTGHNPMSSTCKPTKDRHFKVR